MNSPVYDMPSSSDAFRTTGYLPSVSFSEGYEKLQPKFDENHLWMGIFNELDRLVAVVGIRLRKNRNCRFWVVATRPEFQHQGYATKLLQTTIMQLLPRINFLIVESFAN